MAGGPSIDVSGRLEEQLIQARLDLLRAMVTTFAEGLMGAEADAVCGAGYGERSQERTKHPVTATGGGTGIPWSRVGRALT